MARKKTKTDKLKLFVLERDDYIGLWNARLVVLAYSQKQAKDIAKERMIQFLRNTIINDKDSEYITDIWSDPQRIRCTEIDTTGEAKTVLFSYSSLKG